MLRLSRLTVILTTMFIVLCQWAMGTKPHLSPDFFQMQFAGDIGMVAGGLGYQSKSAKTNVSFLIGFIPKQYIDFENDLVTLNLTARYQPFKLFFRDVNMALNPLIIGGGISVSLGQTYYRYHTSNYPQGYYWWPTNSRIIISFGHSLSIFHEPRKIPRIDLYSQLVTNDLAVYSYSANTIVKLRHIFHFSFGAKIFLNFYSSYRSAT